MAQLGGCEQWVDRRGFVGGQAFELSVFYKLDGFDRWFWWFLEEFSVICRFEKIKFGDEFFWFCLYLNNNLLVIFVFLGFLYNCM